MLASAVAQSAMDIFTALQDSTGLVPGSDRANSIVGAWTSFGNWRLLARASVSLVRGRPGTTDERVEDLLIAWNDQRGHQLKWDRI